MIEQTCPDPGIALFKYCTGKCHAKCLGICIHMVLMNRLNLKCYVYCKNKILSVCEKKLNSQSYTVLQ